jgi:uncharacterized membrane protein (UPF0127 family)
MTIFNLVKKMFCFGLFILTSSQLLASECQENVVSIHGDFGVVDFNVEIAITSIQRTQGLMGRKKLDAQSGMLFLYERPHKISFWMKNTVIPLDILFLSMSGEISHIEHNAQPFSMKRISGRSDTIAVLEINGQSAIREGIKTGDLVRHPFFLPFDVKWSCKIKD